MKLTQVSNIDWWQWTMTVLLSLKKQTPDYFSMNAGMLKNNTVTNWLCNYEPEIFNIFCCMFRSGNRLFSLIDICSKKYQISIWSSFKWELWANSHLRSSIDWVTEISTLKNLTLRSGMVETFDFSSPWFMKLKFLRDIYIVQAAMRTFGRYFFWIWNEFCHLYLDTVFDISAPL